MARSAGWSSAFGLVCTLLKTSLIFRSFRTAGLWQHFCLVQYRIFVILEDKDSIQPFLRWFVLLSYDFNAFSIVFQWMNFYWSFICSSYADLDSGQWFNFHWYKIILSWTNHNQILIQIRAAAFPSGERYVHCHFLLDSLRTTCVCVRMVLKFISFEPIESVRETNVKTKCLKTFTLNLNILFISHLPIWLSFPGICHFLPHLFRSPK